MHHSWAVPYTKQRRFADAASACLEALPASACLEALRLKPDYADAYFCLGAAYLKLNEQDKAIAAYPKAPCKSCLLLYIVNISMAVFGASREIGRAASSSSLREVTLRQCRFASQSGACEVNSLHENT